MVERRREAARLVRRVVDEQADVAEMPVLVSDQGVEHEDSAQVRQKRGREAAKEVLELVERPRGREPGERDERGPLRREERAGRAEAPLEPGEAVGDVRDAERGGDLRRVELALRFPARVRRTLAAALEEKDLAPDAPPAFRQCAVRRVFRRAAHRRADIGAVARERKPRQHAGEGVLVEVHVGPAAGEAVLGDPVRVLQGKAAAHGEDAARVAFVETLLREEVADIGAVRGNRPAAQPAPERLVRGRVAHFQRQKAPRVREDALDADLLPASAVRKPVETEQVRVPVAKREHVPKSTTRPPSRATRP